MNDRESFLRAIDKEPNNRTTKLVFSDWLEEYGTSEADAATVEWIRLTNHELHLTKTGRVKSSSFAWLKKNWERLVATARTHHRKPDADKDVGNFSSTLNGETYPPDVNTENPYAVHTWRSARHLVTHWNLAPPGWNDATPRFYSYRVHIHFGNGFVSAFEARNPHAQAKLNHLVLVDQPLCRIHALMISEVTTNCACTYETYAPPDEMLQSEYFSCGICGQVWDRVRQNVYEPRVTSS